MNFAPELTTSTAVFMTLFAAFLWGTWFISLKYLGDYPTDGFYITLFTTSVIFVWLVGFVLDGPALLQNLRSAWSTDPSIIWVTLLTGALYVIGMRISLYSLRVIGLSLTQPIQASVNLLAGTFFSGLIGGMPANLSIGQLITACLFLVGAVVASMIAGNLRVRAQASQQMASTLKFSAAELWKAVGVLLLASLLLPAYTFGLSYGLRSITHPQGMAVLPFMAMLSTGAFIGALISSGIPLTRNRQWGRVFSAPFSVHKFGIISGLFHYGGNIIHTFATASLSSVVSWPLGLTAGLWTQLWGLAYGEFRGASRRVYAALAGAILFYLIGAYLVAVS